jgi:hypothetical protein
MHDMSADQSAKLQRVAAHLDQLNAAMREAVDSGLSIELTRSARHHDTGGCWGDILRPEVVKRRG